MEIVLLFYLLYRLPKFNTELGYSDPMKDHLLGCQTRDGSPNVSFQQFHFDNLFPALYDRVWKGVIQVTAMADIFVS